MDSLKAGTTINKLIAISIGLVLFSSVASPAPASAPMPTTAQSIEGSFLSEIDPINNNAKSEPSLANVAKEFSSDVELILQSATPAACKCKTLEIEIDKQGKKTQIPKNLKATTKKVGKFIDIEITSNWIASITCEGSGKQKCEGHFNLDKESTWQVAVGKSGASRDAVIVSESFTVVREDGKKVNKMTIDCEGKCKKKQGKGATNEKKIKAIYKARIQDSDPNVDTQLEVRGFVFLKITPDLTKTMCDQIKPTIMVDKPEEGMVTQQGWVMELAVDSEVKTLAKQKKQPKDKDAKEAQKDAKEVFRLFGEMEVRFVDWDGDGTANVLEVEKPGQDFRKVDGDTKGIKAYLDPTFQPEFKPKK